MFAAGKDAFDTFEAIQHQEELRARLGPVATQHMNCGIGREDNIFMTTGVFKINHSKIP
jgi:hypothetical protein